jgi:hypothetical protein
LNRCRHRLAFSRRRSARGMHRRGPHGMERARGMPGAGRTHGPPASKNAGGRNHRFSRDIPAFPARWLERLIRTLPGDRAFLPPSPADHHPRRLDLSVGRSGPYAFAVRGRSFVHAPVSVNRVHAVSRRAHRIPALNVRDDREAPLSHEDGMGAIFPSFGIKASEKFGKTSAMKRRPAKSIRGSTRAQRSKRDRLRGGTQDCFVARAVTA